MAGWRSLLIRLRLLIAAFTPLAVVAMPAPAAAESDLALVQGTHFATADGRPLFVWGVNYVGHADRSWTMWEDGRFDAQVIAADLAKARAAGANVVRIFIRNPLPQEIAAGRWPKLDTVLALAKQQGLRLLITLHDYSETDLRQVAATAGAIARRYAAEAVVFGYDLQNEPHFSDLLASQYPAGLPPLFTAALVRAYGERANQVQVNAWRLTAQGRALIPTRLSEREAYYAANGYRVYLEFVAAIGDWVAARDYAVSVLDYLASPDAARWRPLLNVLDGTVAAWLQPQVAALRAADPVHPITVGYNDPALAQLPANRVLSFVSLHRFPAPGLKPLRVAVATARRLQQTFPDKPVLLEEFGYPNASRPAVATALDEGALLLDTWSANLAGGLKWSLNDVAQGSNPREQSFGLYKTDGTAKPAVAVTRALAEYFATSAPGAGHLTLGEQDGVLQYTFSASDALIVAGRQYQDERLSFAAAGPIQVSVVWTERDVLAITASRPTLLALNPRALLGDSGVRAEYTLTRDGGQAVPFEVRGATVSFAAEAGQRYRLRFARTALDAKVEIVWPHANRPVREAPLANVGAYLFQRGSTAVCGAGPLAVRLWRALNNGVETPLATGKARPTTAGGLTFTAWNFDNVDVSAARDPANKYYFRLGVDGWDVRSNVWSHAVDARTYFPQVDVPAGVADAPPEAVDAKIEVVWPHGNLPVDRAIKANVAAYLFAHSTATSVPRDWEGTVRLWRSLNNGVAEEVAIGRKVLRTVGRLTFPAWEFNDVDVAAARDPLNKYYFRLSVDGLPSYSNIWAHGKDARTYFPQTDVPTATAGCP